MANLASYKDADISKMLQAKVVKHIDGDTVHVAIPNPPEGIQPYEKIRMIGVDTPETVHPNKQVEYFGKAMGMPIQGSLSSSWKNLEPWRDMQGII